MPLHDWSRVPPGLFHHFHQDWSIELARALNRGILPRNVAALIEQRSGAVEPDLLAIHSESLGRAPSVDADGGLDVATLPPPQTQIVRRSSQSLYARRANRIVVRHHLGRVLAVIEIVSPGNKDSRSAVREFVDKAVDFLAAGVQVLILDLLPPTTCAPFGIHKAIWDEIQEEPFDFPLGKDRMFASYVAGEERIAYVEPIGLGDVLPDMPLFLHPRFHVPAPLEVTYNTAWAACPEALRAAVAN